MAKTLITSFTTWKPKQPSNSSDDLLDLILAQQVTCIANLSKAKLLRQMPVCFERSPQLVVEQIDRLVPRTIICCGMAESRARLTIEANGKNQAEVLNTNVDLAALVAPLSFTDISNDAGQFVCNWLYYSVLKHIRDRQLPTKCIFVHVPILDSSNTAAIAQDFGHIYNYLNDL
ncbi:peptidase C15 pyroglutamyl peptidase I [Thalassoporum mexicanum PCC 7367]|uniref:pyroglutamyl-peptidase I family protein n=1 Tax=Thalassoporum mexicanum TaxID=3457544 RepID=UPI00029FCE88|nr:peptidase C15 [Pseudanabaena sp. PCC 7367]AFY69900.1 peptidase C15 pyroglutamyl peptidase I [Pseudanabaena sp. PCC 7367]